MRNWLLPMLSVTLLAAGCQDGRQKAIECFQQDVAQRQAAKAGAQKAYQQGMEEYKNGQLEKAARKLREAVELNDHNAQAWLALGVVCSERNELFEAATAFDRAAVLAPDRYEPLYNLGYLLESVGKIDKAAAKYEQALKRAPGQLDIVENLIRCYIEIDAQPDKIRPLIEQALKSEQRHQWRTWLENQAAKLALAKGDSK